ncbi:MAG TPA: hypothetical protein VKB19_19500 [Pedobacter sp.]|nr:hypothetical protein [Pedobacter sp.]
MKENKNLFFKVWGMPVLLSIITIAGLLSAIVGVGAWHVFSWVALGIPVCVMLKYGVKYFK